MSKNQYPHLVDWAITEKCNLHCRHCRGIPKGELSTERARKLISEIAGLKPKWVIVEGGEPLLRQDIFELLGLMKQNNLEVHLITNGMLLTHQIIATIKQMGIKLMISIDAPTKETYEAIRHGADFEKVVQAARTAAREGLLESINITLLRRNYPEIPGIFELAKSIGVKRITIIGLKPCEHYPEELLTPEEYKEAIGLVCQAAQKTGIEFFFDEPFFWATVKEWELFAHMPEVDTGILVSSTTTCIFGEYLFIEPNGEVRPCSFAPMSVGNVKDKSLGEIWREVLSSPFFRQIKDPNTRTGYCRTCQYLKECKGCRSRTFVLAGDWFAPDPVCPLTLEYTVKRR